MPTEHIRFSYTFDELSDEAKLKAVENIAEKLGGDWWDEDDNDAVREVMHFTLAEKLKSPDWDKFGPGDFPGIHGVSIEGFRVGWGPYVQVAGELDRDNAPGLPWHAHAEAVELTAPHNAEVTGVEVKQVEALSFDCTHCGQTAEVTYGYEGTAYVSHVRTENGLVFPDEETDADHDAWLLEGLPTYDTGALRKVKEAVEAALSAALTAGEKEAEYIGSPERAREHIEASEPDFNEDGSLF